VTSLGFVEYFDGIEHLIAEVLTQYDTTKRAGTECTQTLEIVEVAGVLRVDTVHTWTLYKQHFLTYILLISRFL